MRTGFKILEHGDIDNKDEVNKDGPKVRPGPNQRPSCQDTSFDANSTELITFTLFRCNVFYCYKYVQLRKYH